MTMKQELRLCNFGLSHPEPRRFVTSQWGHPKVYLVWRMFWGLFHMTCVVISLVVASQKQPSPPLGVAVWFIYLTNWIYLLLTFSTMFDAVILLYVKVKRTDILAGYATEPTLYMKISWLLYSVVTAGSLHVSAFYWIFIFKYQQLTAVRFILHGLNSLYVLLNLIVTATPVRIYHVIYPVLFGTLYAVFGILYHVFGGTNQRGDPYIYRIVDWSNLKRTLPLVCLSTFVVLPMVYMLVYFIHLLRGRMHAQCTKHESIIADTSKSDSDNISA